MEDVKSVNPENTGNPEKKLINYRYTEEEFEKITDDYLRVLFGALLIFAGIAGMIEMFG